MMMSFDDFIYKYKLRNEATSNIKLQQILSSLSLIDVRIYLRDGPFKTDIGFVNLHSFEDAHWVVYIHECYTDSYDCAPPQKLSRFIIKRNG